MMNEKEIKALEEKYRDRFMEIFMEAAAESGYEMSGIEINVEKVIEEKDGTRVYAELAYYWDNTEEGIIEEMIRMQSGRVLAN